MSARSRSERPYLARLAIVLSLPVALTIYAIAFYTSVNDLDLASKAYPQTLIIGLLLLLASLVWTEIRTWHRASDHARWGDTWRRWHRTAMTAAWTAAFIWAIELIGFYEALVLYMVVQMPLLGVRRPIVIAAYTAGTALGLYLLFDLTLRVRMPPGLLIG